MKMKAKTSAAIIVAAACALFALQQAQAGPEAVLSKGQTLYVPVYSHIYSGNKERPFDLTVTVSIRNTDPKFPVTVMYADFYNSEGKLLKKFIEAPRELKPLESIRYVIGESDRSGGSGANFLIGWKSEQPVNLPVVESVMIGTQGQQGISFTSQARPIDLHDK